MVFFQPYVLACKMCKKGNLNMYILLEILKEIHFIIVHKGFKGIFKVHKLFSLHSCFFEQQNAVNIHYGRLFRSDISPLIGKR